MNTACINAARSGLFTQQQAVSTAIGNLLAGLLCLALLGTAHGQASNTESEQRSIDAARRQQEREEQQRQRLLSAPEVRLQTGSATTHRLPRDESPCFRIHAIDLAGPDITGAPGSTHPQALPQGWASWLRDALDAGPGPSTDSPLHPVSGICLGSQGIAILQQRAQAALLARGYITSRALVEAQNLSSGRLRLRIIPGLIEDIRIEDDRPVGPIVPSPSGRKQQSSLLDSASPARPGDVLNLRDLEQTLENLKRVPSAEADIRIEPGTAPATSDWVIRHQQGFPLRLSLTLDDAGSPGTGIYQGSATASWDAPLGLNDLFYVTTNSDLGGGDEGYRGTRGNTVHYSLPWGYWNLGLTRSSNRYYQSVVGLTQTYVYSGTSTTTEMRLARVLARSALSTTSASLKAFQRRSNNYIDDTEVQIQRRVVGGWEAGVSHRTRVGDTAISASFAYRVGTGLFGSLPAPEEASGMGTSRFGLTVSDINLQIPLLWLSQTMRYSSALRWQHNLTPLSPQERFAIGGRYTVRGFDGVNVLSAERGLLLRNEISTALLASAPLSIFLGVDYGYVSGPSSANLAGQQLAGAVLGLRGAWQQLSYEIFIGTPLDKPQSFRTASHSAGFNLFLTL